MAHVLFSSSGYPFYSIQEERLVCNGRLYIFLIAGLCGGLPALVWALRLLYGHYKSGGRISALVIMLLLSDLLELLLSPYIMTKLLQDDYCWDSSTACHLLTSVWSGSMICGFHLQQMVALEAVLSSRHPPCSAHAFFSDCSVIIATIAFFYFFFCEVFRATFLVVLTLPLLLMTTLTSCILTCRAPPQINNIPYRTRRPSSTVLAFVTYTLILYGTLAIMFTITSTPPFWDQKYVWSVFVMGVCLMSLNVIIDPLLCVLVCRRHTGLIKPVVNI